MKKDIEILYAVEYGAFEWSLETSRAKHDIRFVFVRNNKDYYSSRGATGSYSYESLSDSTDTIRWSGVDLANAVALRNRQVDTRQAEMLFAHTVYRHNGNYSFVEQVKELLMENAKVAQLIESYRSSARTSFAYMMEKESDPFLDNYMDVVRELAMIEWLNLNFVSLDRMRPNKLVETDFNQVLDDLEATLGAELYAELSRLAEKCKGGNTLDRVKRPKVVDQWIVRTLKESYDWFLKAEAKEANIPDDAAKFRAILDEALKTKFDKFKSD